MASQSAIGLASQFEDLEKKFKKLEAQQALTCSKLAHEKLDAKVNAMAKEAKKGST